MFIFITYRYKCIINYLDIDVYYYLAYIALFTYLVHFYCKEITFPLVLLDLTVTPLHLFYVDNFGTAKLSLQLINFPMAPPTAK